MEEIAAVKLFTSGVIAQLIKCHQEDEENKERVISKSFMPMLMIIQLEATESDRLIFQEYWFSNLQIFATLEPLAGLLIGHSTPNYNVDQSYTDTLLGALLNLSCLPKSPDAPFEFFEEPLREVIFYIMIFLLKQITEF